MPRINLPATIDWFIVGLVTAVILATFLPCRGEGATVFGFVTNAAIALLFFLHGAKLSRQAILDGIGNWRLHLTVLASTFVMFPLIGLALRAGLEHWVSAPMLDGLLFLCLLPSTVQSSIAFTSIARGNVPAAVCSASASNVLGMFVTPVLVGFLLASELSQGAAGGGISLSAVGGILLQLLAPFLLGHLSRPLTEKWIGRHKFVVNLVDRGSILLVVYTAFSAAVVEGLWHRLSVGDLILVTLLDAAVLFFALFATTVGARRLGFNRADEIAIVFCGSKKSLASGVPMAGVLFPAATVGPMIVPLMIFHQMQLMVCAVLARRYAETAPKS
ncbi:MAG TPA: bile acid:sodium symporter family protein [Alphaproteobacteria bacterium]|jgi:sodium/bile acid cotransporter 7|nr:bile acid:sodium symporter family protein [Alphaproteobacteria bacterium]